MKTNNIFTIQGNQKFNFSANKKTGRWALTKKDSKIYEIPELKDFKI